MKTDATSSISSTPGLSAGWSAHIASGTANTRADKSKINRPSISDSLETSDRDADGRLEPNQNSSSDRQGNETQGFDRSTAVPAPPAGTETLGSLLDWSG